MNCPHSSTTVCPTCYQYVVDKPNFKGFSFPLKEGGDLHCNYLGEQHWKIQRPGGSYVHLNNQELGSLIDAWSTTGRVNLNFKAFK